MLHLLGSGLIGQVAVPGASEVAIAPRPLLLAGREVVAGHMQHAGTGVVLVASLEVEARVHAHIARRHVDVLIVRDVDTCRIVHLVVSARGNGERRHGALAMVEHGIDVGREHTLVLVVHLHSRVGPPKEGLRHVGAVVEAAFDFQIGTARAQREACHTLLVEHLLHLAHPHAHRAIGILLDAGVDRHEGRRTVVLGPVELDSTRDPRADESHQCRLDNVVVVDEVALCNLVVGHLHAATQFGQHHHLDVLVLQPDGQILFVDFLVAHGLNDGIWIDHTT